MTTTYERGVQHGKIEGKIEALHKTAIRLLAARFGSLPSEVEKRVSELSVEQLEELLVDIVRAGTIEDLSVLK